ncbi:hypothetical protein [Trinickia symbiotica]|uniref:Uncharacterized protein n=1 Tax=Trinickia symbiotica TaxID=863227 RepID=A0A2N7XA53_9BURK|nr:hypothetical protein [Trinickia symbiotica]PMS38470.1 hypothetical protein C0Z20_00870 [Trinickia symbiotica]
MGPKTALTLAGVLALIGAGVYLDRKYTQAGGASGIAFNFASTIWNNAAGAMADLGGAALDALPASQVPAVVDMAGPKPDTGTIQYESLLMGLGN